HIIGEHTDGTHAELIAVPADYVHPLPNDLSFEEAAAFPLVFETAYRMLVTRANLQEAEGGVVWGAGVPGEGHARDPPGGRVGSRLGRRRRSRLGRPRARENARWTRDRDIVQ